MLDNKIFVVNFFVSIIPAAIIANWFYYKNDRSVAASILLHSMLNGGIGVNQCGASREVHCDGSVFRNSGRTYGRRSPIIFRGSAQFLVRAITTHRDIIRPRRTFHKPIRPVRFSAGSRPCGATV
jgi:hypothetical protein